MTRHRQNSSIEPKTKSARVSTMIVIDEREIKMETISLNLHVLRSLAIDRCAKAY